MEKIEFATTDRVNESPEEMSELLRHIAALLKEPDESEEDWLRDCFVSDESRLADFFYEDRELVELGRRIVVSGLRMKDLVCDVAVAYGKSKSISPEERASRLGYLDTLAQAYSVLPRDTESRFGDTVRGPWTDRVTRSVTLKIDDEVAEWLEENAIKKSHLINFLLKREAQRDKRRKAGQGTLDKAS